MSTDEQYESVELDASELEHEYGENVHILQDPLALTRLARLCSPEVGQPAFNRMMAELYRQMIWHVVSSEFPRRETNIRTRMHESTDRGTYGGTVIDPRTSVVTVDVARAGMVPSEVCYRRLNEILDHEVVRQDHLFMSRRKNERGSVTGVDIHGDKVGGPVDGGYLLLPDPMGATGSSMSRAIEYYKTEVGGSPERVVAMNLIVTPEFIRRIREEHPDVECYAMRLDRGMSPEEILETRPGARWEEESGLDDDDYIVPGGGGFGELMNNSWT